MCGYFASLSLQNHIVLFPCSERLTIRSIGPKPAASPAPIAKSPAASTSTLSPKPESKPSLPTPTNGSLSTGKPQPERKPSVSIDKPLDSSKEVRSGKTDGITFDKKDDKTRDKCIELLYDALVLDAVARESLFLSAKEHNLHLPLVSQLS